MRYYSNDYRTRLKGEITRANYSVDDPNYVSNVTDFCSELGNEDPSMRECEDAAWNAHRRIYRAKGKLEKLCDELDRFYDSADKAAESVINIAQSINHLVTDAANTLKNLDDALNSTGKYQGRPVTVRSINDAGARYALDLRKYNIWKDIVYDLSENGSVNPDAAMFFLNCLKKKNARGEYCRTEQDYVNTFAMKIKAKVNKGDIATRVRYLPVLSELFNFYKIYRFEGEYDATCMSEETLEACIAVYEILNPKAAQIMNNFFEPAWLEIDYDDALTASNIDYIKYDLYTSEPRERRLVLTFLPYLKLCTLTGDDTASYDPYLGVLKLNLGKFSRSGCSFFHEFGHALDDLLLDDEKGTKDRILNYVSCKYANDIYNDFNTAIDTAIDNLDCKLSKDELFDLNALLKSQDNVNVSKSDDHKYYKKLISGSKNVKNAYNDLRKYFGYREYIFNEAGAKYGFKQHAGVLDITAETSLSDDMFSGITNGKLGAAAGAHTIIPEPSSQSEIKSAKDLKKHISENSYWAQVEYFTYDRVLKVFKIPDVNEQPLCSEFFADSFEDRIFGVDQTKNKEFFPTAIKNFDKTLNGALAKVPDDVQ